MEKQTTFGEVTALRDAVTEHMEQYARQLEGMELQNEANSVREKIEDFRKGLFSVLFTGGFSAGKSTALNALMGNAKMHTSSQPDTPIITKIANGRDDGTVQIFYRDSSREPLTISSEQFYNSYRVDAVNPEKYQEVDFAVFRIPLANPAVQFVDSPGMQNSDVEDRIAGEFSAKADAIIYVANAVKPFEADERKYILQHYVGKHPQNVFFVINWFNMVNSSEEEFTENIHKVLDEVFTDEEDRFDAELYEKRVFYVDAYQSECARCHMPYIVKKGMKRVEETPDDSYTGIPEFETEMNAFLSSSNKDRECYRKFLYGEMASMFVKAEQARDERLEMLQKGTDALLKEKAQSETELKELRQTVRRIQNAIRTATQQILLSVNSSYIAYVNAVEADWTEYFSENEVRFNLWDMAKIAAMQGKNAVVDLFHSGEVPDAEALVRNKQFQELSAPIIDGVTRYLESKQAVMEAELGMAITSAAKTLTSELDDLTDDLSNYGTVISQQELVNILTKELNIDTDKYSVKANLGQLVIALIFTNPENAVEALTGDMKWGDFIKDIVVTQIVEVLIATIVSALFGPIVLLYLLGRACLALLKIGKQGKNNAARLLDHMKENVIGEMRSEKSVSSARNRVEIMLREGMNKVNDVAKKWVESAEQTQKQIDSLIERINEGETDQEAYQKEMTARITRLEGLFEDLYRALNGSSVDAAGIRKYAGK